MLETIISFIQNNIAYILGALAGGGGVFGAIIFGYIIKIWLNFNKMKKYPQKYINDIVYNLAQFIYKNVIANVKDKNTRFKLVTTLDSFGDIANKTWDAGIRGKEKPI